MPDPTTPFPYLDPSQAPAWLDVQRKQQLAQMLMGAFQQSNQTPDNWNSMRVVPRRGALGSVATLASALLAGKANQGAMDAQQRYMTGMFGGGQQPQPTGPGAGIISPDAPPAAQDAAQAVTSGNVPGSQPPPGVAPENPMIPPGMGRGTANALMGMLGPQKYAESIVAPQFSPLEIVKQARAAGLSPQETQDLLRRTLAKGTYIAPIEQREGSVERDPITNAVIGVNPKMPQGGVNFYDPKGNLTGSGMSPGAASAIAASSGASTAGDVANKYNVLPTAGGGSTVVGGPHTGLDQPPKIPAGNVPTTAPPAPGAPPAAAAPPANSPWATIPKLQVSTAIGAPDTFTQQKLKDAATKHAEIVTKIGAEADLADQKMNYNNEALKALPNAEVGPVSHFLTENRAKLVEWGLPAKWVPGSGSVTPTYELNKNLLNSALQGAKQIYGARMTGNEVMLQKNEASPSVATSSAAIKSLIAQDNARNAYFKQRAQDYGEYAQRGGDPNRFESWYASKFPLQQFALKYSTPPAAIQQLQAHPEQAPFFKQKYGWLPDGASQ